MDPEAPPGQEFPARSRGRIRARRPFPLSLLALLLFLWLLSIAWTVAMIRGASLSSWSGWRLADQQLRLTDFETSGQPMPLLPLEVERDRQALMEHWAALFETDAAPRSRAAAAILWHLAGQAEKADKAKGPPENPDPAIAALASLVVTLVNGERADDSMLAYWRDFLTTGGECYRWEEQLYLELAQRSKDPSLSKVAEVSSARSRRCLDAEAWSGRVQIFLAVAGVLCLGAFLWRSRDKIRLRPVPAVFHAIGWRRLLAGVAIAELLGIVLVFVAGWVLAGFTAWTHGSLAIYQTIWRAFPPLLLMVLFFRMPATGVRALRLDRGSSFAPVLGAVGLSVIVYSLCWWLLPHGGEHEMGEMLDPWTFGPSGLWYMLWLGCVVAPLCEEIVYRGFIFNAISARFGLLPGLIVANVLFTLIHPYGWDGSVTVFFMGVSASLLYRLSGSLAAAVIFHSLVNLHATLSSWCSFEAPYW